MTDEGTEWMLMGLDETMARRQGLPFRVPVPKSEFESLAEKGLPGDKVREWIQAFLGTSPLGKDATWRRRNSSLVSQLEGFVDKAPMWEKAQKLFAANDFATATKTLKRISIMNPDDHAAKMNYASALANQGDYDKAFKALRQVRETFKGEPDYHVTVAQIYVAKEDHDSAIEELLKALEADPAHGGAMNALCQLGVLSKIYENPRDAMSLLYIRTDSVLDYLKGQWDELAEPTADFFAEQMGYHESEGRFEVALEAADRGVKLAGENDTLAERLALGRVASLRALERKDDAVKACEAYAEKAPKSAVTLVEWAACLDDPKEALSLIDRALAIDPGELSALHWKFWPADATNPADVNDALPKLKAHVDAHANSAGARRSLARALLVVDRRDEALAEFKEAIVLAADDDDLRSEWWTELAANQEYQAIIDDAEALGDMATRDWKLRWNEAEAYKGLKRMMEARACFTQINADDTLHVDLRKRAKRAAMEVGTAETA